MKRREREICDYGGEPLVFNICRATLINENFRTALWSGEHLQLTLMSIPAHSEIGVEMHSNIDQFIGVASGRARVYTGKCHDQLEEKACVGENDAILIPAGTWHNVVNASARDLKLFSLYAPPAHAFGTVHKTKADAERDEH